MSTHSSSKAPAQAKARLSLKMHDRQDRLSAAYASSSEFWKMIQDRRQEQGIPWEEATEQLGLDG